MKSSLGKVYGHHHDLVNRYGLAVLQMNTNMLFVVHDYHRVGSKSNMMGLYMEQELVPLAKQLSLLTVLSRCLLLTLLFSV